jgi:hypothetical protein
LDALERGINSGEFRAFDVNTMLHVVMAPLMLLNVWRYSFDSCCTEPLDPQHYLEVHIDMVLRGLRKTPESGV